MGGPSMKHMIWIFPKPRERRERRRGGWLAAVGEPRTGGCRFKDSNAPATHARRVIGLLCRPRFPPSLPGHHLHMSPPQPHRPLPPLRPRLLKLATCNPTYVLSLRGAATHFDSKGRGAELPVDANQRGGRHSGVQGRYNKGLVVVAKSIQTAEHEAMWSLYSHGIPKRHHANSM